ncbi:MAG: transposase, partial [Thaumarchaeota archaeon]|nr:transposase [Nitrososphaerota archaeon]
EEEHLKLSDRAFRCSACGIILDRDVNAARNILNLGLEQAHAETEPIPVTAVRRIGKFSQGSRKPTAFRRG